MQAEEADGVRADEAWVDGVWAVEAWANLDTMPDDLFRKVIAACGESYQSATNGDTNFGWHPPHFEAVKGLGCVSKGMREQLRRLQPLVDVQSLAVVQRPAHGPWRVSLSYSGELTEAVVEQARQGRVRSITTRETSLTPAVVRRVVLELLGCSLLQLDLQGLEFDDTWVSAFGEAAVCSETLLSLTLTRCLESGPLPELRLPQVQELFMDHNSLTGGLEPLLSCTALRVIQLRHNKLTGGLGPLQSCKALRALFMTANLLTGDLEPLRGCTALIEIQLMENNLMGGLEPLQGCKALEYLYLSDNKLSGGLGPLEKCTALQDLCLYNNQFTGGLEPLRCCKALKLLMLEDNELLTGDLEPLRACPLLQTRLMPGSIDNTQLLPTTDDYSHFVHLDAPS